MALIDCPGCQRSISDSSRKCPHCDYALRSDTVTESAFYSAKEILLLVATAVGFDVVLGAMGVSGVAVLWLTLLIWGGIYLLIVFGRWWATRIAMSELDEKIKKQVIELAETAAAKAGESNRREQLKPSRPPRSV